MANETGVLKMGDTMSELKILMDLMHSGVGKFEVTTLNNK